MLDIFRGVGVEVSLDSRDNFLIIMETLKRIGVSSKKENVLYQSCHIFHKQGRYAIVHFKEMFTLDGKPSNMTFNDIQRRNKIALLLEEWGLLKLVEPKSFNEEDLAPIHQIKIIPSSKLGEWRLVSKYNIGKKFT